MIYFFNQLYGNITFSKTYFNSSEGISSCLENSNTDDQIECMKSLRDRQDPLATQNETYELVWHFDQNSEIVYKLNSSSVVLVKNENYWYTLPDLFRVYDAEMGECFSLDYKTMTSSFRYKISLEECQKLINVIVKKTKGDQKIKNLFTGYPDKYGVFRLLALKEVLISPGGMIPLENLDSRNPLFTYKSIVQGDIYNELQDPSVLVLIYEKGPFQVTPQIIDQKYVFVQSCSGNACSNEASSKLAIPFTSYSEDPDRLVLVTMDCMMVMQEPNGPPPNDNPFKNKRKKFP